MLTPEVIEVPVKEKRRRKKEKKDKKMIRSPFPTLFYFHVEICGKAFGPMVNSYLWELATQRSFSLLASVSCQPPAIQRPRHANRLIAVNARAPRIHHCSHSRFPALRPHTKRSIIFPGVFFLELCLLVRLVCRLSWARRAD